MSTSSPTAESTEKKGPHLTLMPGHAPLSVEAEQERFFGATAPSVHGMGVELERRELIRQRSGEASVEAALDPAELPLPLLQPNDGSVARY